MRINDIIASREDLQTLDMQGIDHIEFIDNPGVRYGEGLRERQRVGASAGMDASAGMGEQSSGMGVAYVINIKVKRPVSGYVVGTQLTNTLTTVNGNESLFGKINHGRSEFALSYDPDYHNFKGAEYDELAAYELESGDITSVHRYSLDKRGKSFSHNAQLTYSLSDSNYVLQARFSGNSDIQPQRRNAEIMMMNDVPYNDLSSTRSSSPSLDLYYHQDFRRHQSLTANVVGTYIKT